ncbi:M24 family metallopeptidase [Corynebacterium lipophiloflavum]|uniref:Creatinase n=1 Tax=Corynebacterium lipophiloflavum (strain ATCC 700352 / DSM 44291 / CCUG 37336 / JCM 10383 / DMMZ 1944) TaxID=525263 RepID=C0XT39_CORLD|nr:Xaa-Pro peptidase family protein [Corynebacterium lipophiloflavum]EEI16578.1 Creatinase [Corynebacterium lipophiloflavum DSM 44291]
MSDFRLVKAQRLVAQAGLAGLVVGPGTELFYLTGLRINSHERLSAPVVPAEGEVSLVVPATDAASISTTLPVVSWRDGEDPYRLCTQITGEGVLGLGTALTADHVLRMQALAPRTVLAQDVLAELFMVKEPEEIAQLRAAAEAIDRIHARVPELLVAGCTEEDVAAQLRELITAEHASVDFVIVGSGPNGANPHHDFSSRVLEPGDAVVVDIGGALASGYRSDCTRTYQVPGVGEEAFATAYAVLEEAFDAAIAAVRPGVAAAEIDTAARRVIEDAGYGENFFHRTGHGIGLDTHEAPYIIAGNDQVIEENMAFSVEPGIYVPGKWGMRIEDIVVVTEDGCEQLNRRPRALG